ncbi:23S rRNA (adenine(2030)-N(6))-methyltransferase RlmJ [Hahella sp. CCB-MM4]|uniref:23S rRNA (adenine(2030)-N(6))-methyltransferase RlmJ n=1 Tax=Hahella sp. (strain CCB-MM4) TaxID=1926491 RepID=UPI000B9AECBF|nr:23S rRNA (adenine(2030)-N(6))-methyltransferase RlmJ [Hahella sp. CCB-MM4]OZG75164.1 23S rRNA (adenine(2030)-N(6))-methyltransferase RlmJ [Hahella sp. CCB-MM4]
MLSYQHAYHAGNFADVHKHWLLVLLLEALSRKDKPWCYLDTHAGRGIYSLDSAMAMKTAEWREGVARLLETSGSAPESVQSYLRIVQSYLRIVQSNLRTVTEDVSYAREIHMYPGSPEFARRLMRQNDREVLCELHPQEIEHLKKHFHKYDNVHLHFRDGFEGVFAMVPPPEKRGLVLIDPSYELKQDYQRIPAYLEKLHKRWAGATVAIWYPVLTDERHQTLLKGVRESALDNVLRSEIRRKSEIRKKEANKGMVGSGMLILNPPWKVDLAITSGWSYLVNSLQLDDQQSVAVDWLKPEKST